MREALAGRPDRPSFSFSRPTFGYWVQLLGEAREELRSINGERLEGIFKAGVEVIAPAGRGAEESILELRNMLAHGGISPEMATDYLEQYGHRGRFEGFWVDVAAPFFANLDLIGVAAPERFLLMRGPTENSGTPLPFACMEPALLARASSEPVGSVFAWWKESERSSILFPLIGIGRVRLKTADSSPHLDSADATFVYFRQVDSSPEYAIRRPAGVTSIAPEGLRTAFQLQYPLDEWRREIEEAEGRCERLADRERQLREDLRKYSFRDKMKAELQEIFVGRGDQVEQVRKWLDNHSQGVGVVLGPPGSGKTAFAAQIAHMVQQSRKDAKVIRYFFKRGDHRCSLRAFLDALRLHLEDLGHKPIALPSPPDEAVEKICKALIDCAETNLGNGKRYQKLVILLDGIDEIDSIDRGPLKLIIDCQPPGVVWLVLGREIKQLSEGLASGTFSSLLGESGIPPLSRRDVRELLLAELGPRLYEFLVEESSQDRFLTILTERARGLPLYLNFVLRDLASGKFNFFQPEELPAGLDNYYARLITDLAFDSSRTIAPRIVSLIAMAHRPLTPQMLMLLLEEEPLSSDKDWEAVFSSGLRSTQIVLKRDRYWEDEEGYSLYHDSFRDYLYGQLQPSVEHVGISPDLRLAKKRLADFCGRWREWNVDSPERDYSLRFSVTHLQERMAWPELFSLFTEIDFLEARIELGQVHDIAAEMREAADGGITGEQAVLLRRLAAVIQEDSDFLTRHPTCLFQVVANVLSALGALVNSNETRPSEEDRLLDAWRNYCKESGRIWLRQLWPQRQGCQQGRVSLRAGPGDVTHVIMSSDGRLVASLSFPCMDPITPLVVRQGNMAVWYREGGLLFRKEWTSNEYFVPLAFGPAPDEILIGTRGGVSIWNIANDFPETTFDNLDGRLVACSPVSAGGGVRLAYSDGTIISIYSSRRIHRERLDVVGELSCADVSMYPDLWMAVTLEGKVFRKELGECVTTHFLPQEMGFACRLRRGHRGLYSCSEDEGTMASNYSVGIESLFSGLALEEDCSTDFFHQFGLLIGATRLCNAQGALVAAAVLREATDEEVEGFIEDYRNEIGEVSVWQVDVPNNVKRLKWKTRSSCCVNCSSDGGLLGFGFEDGEVRIVEVAGWTEVGHYKSGSLPVTSLLISKSRYLIVASAGQIESYPTYSGVKDNALHGRKVTTSAASPNGRLFATASEDGRIVMWNSESGSPLRIHTPTTRFFEADSSSGKLVETECRDAVFQSRNGHEGAVTKLWFTPDSRFLFSFGLDGSAWRWSCETGEASESVGLDSSVAVSPARVWACVTNDGKRMAMMDGSGEIAVWDIGDKLSEAFRRPDVSRVPLGFSLSPRGDLVAFAGCSDSEQEIQKLADGSYDIQPPEVTVEVVSIASGTTLFSLSTEGYAFQELALLRGPRGIFLPEKVRGLKEIVSQFERVVQGLEQMEAPGKETGDIEEEVDFLLWIDGLGHARIFEVENGEEVFSLPLTVIQGRPVTVEPTRKAGGFALVSRLCSLVIREEGVEVFWGEGDLNALAEDGFGGDYLPFSKEHELAVSYREDCQEICWHPRPLSNLTVSPDGRTFLGIEGAEVRIFRVEVIDG